MKPLPLTDWEEFTIYRNIQGQDYAITAHVFLELKREPDEYGPTGYEEKVTTANLEGWETFPLHASVHEKEIEKEIMSEIHERYEQ